jgi:hypothetical protein
VLGNKNIETGLDEQCCVFKILISVLQFMFKIFSCLVLIFISRYSNETRKLSKCV